MLKILFFLFLGYLIYIVVRTFLLMKNASQYREKSENGKSYFSRKKIIEKDISDKAEILEEKWLDGSSFEPEKKNKR